MSMNQRFAGKVALITGGSSGIGAATARRFADEGATAVICGRRQRLLEKTVAAIRETGGRADWIAADVSDEIAFTAAVDETIRRYARLDVLVNNAATASWAMIEGSSTVDWNSCLQGSLSSVYFGTRAVLPQMKKQGGGAIVNISSVCGVLGTPGMAAYSAAKAGIVGFTQVAALEAAPDNIRVNVVLPGVVMTPPTAAMLPDEKAVRSMARSVPLGRIGTPEELAGAILFLASDDAAYITGTCLTVDGGRTCELNTGSAKVDALA